MRGALLDVEDLARVVAQPRETEADEPVTDSERRQAVADGEVEGALGAGDLREDPLARVRLVLARVDEGAELGGSDRSRGRARRLQIRIRAVDLATPV